MASGHLTLNLLIISLMKDADKPALGNEESMEESSFM